MEVLIEWSAKQAESRQITESPFLEEPVTIQGIKEEEPVTASDPSNDAACPGTQMSIANQF